MIKKNLLIDFYEPKLNTIQCPLYGEYTANVAGMKYRVKLRKNNNIMNNII